MSASFPEYGERVAEFSGMHLVGDWHVKVYTIDAGAGTRPEESLEASLAQLPRLLPPEVGGSVHGEAFVVVHAGEDSVWLLVHWWTDACLLHHRMVAASLETPDSFDIEVPETLIACTWELAVVAFEREAWVRSAQRRGAAADFEAYRADVMERTLV